MVASTIAKHDVHNALGYWGTLAASTLVSEWFKRRELCESIKCDLEVYEKLPDCEAKTELLGYVEVRVRRLIKAKQPARAVVPHFVAMIISTVILVTIGAMTALRRRYVSDLLLDHDLRGADGDRPTGAIRPRQLSYRPASGRSALIMGQTDPAYQAASA
jgi:hypothetical protein